MDRLPPIATTLYAQLEELALSVDVREVALAGRGAAQRREIKGKIYWYWSARAPGESPRSVYLGPDNAATRALVEKLSVRHLDARAAVHAIESATAAFVAAGGMAHQPGHARVFQRLAEARFFQKGVIAVGSHAFLAMGNMLGFRWSAAEQGTVDLDFARAEHITLAVPAQREMRIDVTDELKKLDDTYFLVPRLPPGESSVSIRSHRSQVTVDFLTVGRVGGKPVFMDDLGIAAAPMRFMDYLLGATPERVLLIGRRAIPALVPEPGRFAFHKMVISEERPASSAVKARKDLAQAAQLLRALDEVRPASVRSARAALSDTPGARKRWSNAVQALRRMDGEAADIATS